MMPPKEYTETLLTNAEVGAIVLALQTAAATYRENAKRADASKYLNLAQSFRRQYAEALHLAERLDAANRVEVR